MNRLDFPFELKALDQETGEFEGYASIFGNKDQGGDIVQKGAFSAAIKSRGPKGVKMLADHDSTKRVGVWTEMQEDNNGLKVKGRLLLEKQIGKETHIDLKSGALSGLSIGGRTKSDSYDGRKRARVIKEFDLYEISLVTFPMNEQAQVFAVKSLSDLSADDFREIEATLRTKGLSRTDAVKAVSGFKEWLRRDAEAPVKSSRDEKGAGELAELIRRNIATLLA